DELHLAFGGTDHFLQDRRELLARSAPGRPEIDQHRLALRFLDHVLHEGLGGRVLDKIVRDHGSAVLQHGVLPWRPTVGSAPKSQYIQLNGVHGGECNRSGSAPAAAATGTIRGGWPVASRNRTRSARAIEVVMVFTSG